MKGIKIDKNEFKLFMNSIRFREATDGMPFSDDEIINELSDYIENNPKAIIVSPDWHLYKMIELIIGYIESKDESFDTFISNLKKVKEELSKNK